MHFDDALHAMVLCRDIEGIPFAFVPSLCRCYSIPNELVMDLTAGSTRLSNVRSIPCIEQELNEFLKAQGVAGIYRDHKPGIAIILTQRCNLTCSYCMAKQGTFGIAVSKMNISLAKQQLRGILEIHPDTEFIKFFGGEPTIEIGLINELCSFVTDELGLHPKFAVTTNGTLSPTRHIDTWEKYRVSVAVSVDGPKEIHDEERKTVSGSGSYDKALAYCEYLAARNFPFAVTGVFDARHRRYGVTYLQTIQFLNQISPLVKVQFAESLGDFVTTSHNVADLTTSLKKEVTDAVDLIMNQIASGWVSPRSSNWTYDNNIFRYLAGLASESARPYKHCCSASNLTSIFPSGKTNSCYTLSERKAYDYGDALSPIEKVEVNRKSFQQKHTWDYLETTGTKIPWYRGIVGDICVADMMNYSQVDNGAALQSSPLYGFFQQTASLRILEHIPYFAREGLRGLRLTHALEMHSLLTGGWTGQLTSDERSKLTKLADTCPNSTTTHKERATCQR